MKTALPFMRLACFISAVWLIPTLAWGQHTVVVETKNYTLRLSERAWFSTGGSQFNLAGPGGFPNVLSELKWKKLNSSVLEFRADTLIRDKYLFQVGMAFGYIGGGTLRDQDFAGPDRTELFSDTESAVEADGVAAITVDAGYRMWAWTAPNTNLKRSVDILIGFRHWKERYVATKTKDLLDPTQMIPQEAAISEEFRWTSVRLGVQSTIDLLPDLSFKGKVIFVPWSRFELKDFHHLRGDLRQDPSFAATIDRPFWKGGVGGELEVGFAYRIWQSLSFEAGYQWWYQQSGAGTIVARSNIQGDTDLPLNEVRTQRYGATIGISYTF